MLNLVAILFSIFSLVSCQVPANYHQASQGAAILSDARYLAGDGTFGAAYSQEDGVEFKEESDEHGNRKGSYSYVDPTGQRRTVSYTAGKDGFRPVGDHIPAAPPQLPRQEYPRQAEFPRQEFPRQADYSLGQYNPQDYQLPKRPEYQQPFLNDYQGRYDPRLRPDQYSPFGRPYAQNPYQPFQNPNLNPNLNPYYPGSPFNRNDPFNRNLNIPGSPFNRNDPFNRNPNLPGLRPFPDPLQRPFPDPLQRPIPNQGPLYQPGIKTLPSSTFRPIPSGGTTPVSLGQKFAPTVRPVSNFPRPQSHYSPEYLSRLYPEYQSSGLETIGKAGPQYSAAATESSRKFNPPGKLEFKRTPDGFSYTFNKT